MDNKILILTSGPVTKLDAFKEKGLTTASFNDICFKSGNSDLYLKGGESLKNFSLIYFRMVGKSLEVATLVSRFAKENGIKIVDKIYQNSQLTPVSLSKTLELRLLSEKGVAIPVTVFGDFSSLNFPYIVKSTTGQRAREVWKVDNEEELEHLRTKFVKGKFYFAQEFIPKAKRIRALVVGDKVVGAILRQTKWNKDETKETLNPIPEEVVNLAIKASNAVELDICGVDILLDEHNDMHVIEANAAPSWKLINKYCGINVEDEIIKYLQGQL